MSSKLDMEKFERLEKTIKMGRRSFLLKQGLLGWGLTSGIIYAYITERSWQNRIFHWINGILLFCLAGYFLYGPLMWRETIKQYEKEKTKLHDILTAAANTNSKEP